MTVGLTVLTTVGIKVGIKDGPIVGGMLIVGVAAVGVNEGECVIGAWLGALTVIFRVEQ